MKNILICSIFAALLLTDCVSASDKKVKGSGTVTTEQRSVSSFDKIEIGGVFKVFLMQSDTESAKVEIDDNLQQYVKVYNKGNTLVLDIEKGINFQKTTQNNVYITLKDINELDIAGVCTIETNTPLTCGDLKLDMNGVTNAKLELYCDKVSADLDGVGNIKLNGETAELVVEKDGVGSFDAENLKAAKVSIRNSGVGSSNVYATKELSMRNSGVGSITYSGDAVIKSIESGGVGKIRKAK